MKRIGLLMAVLCGFIFNGCANRRQEYQEYYKQFEINEQRAFRFSPLNNAEKDEVKIQILKENGFYYYNADVKKCYWVVLIFHGVSFDAVDCAAVFDLLINKGEYNQPAEKY